MLSRMAWATTHFTRRRLIGISSCHAISVDYGRPDSCKCARDHGRGVLVSSGSEAVPQSSLKHDLLHLLMMGRKADTPNRHKLPSS